MTTHEHPERDRQGRPYVSTLDVKGKRHDVFIDADEGLFVAHIGDVEPIKAKSIDALRKQLLKAMASFSRDSIRVPFLVFDTGHEYRYNTRKQNEVIKPIWKTLYIRGVHGSNDNALVDDGKPGAKREQYMQYRHGEDTFQATMPQAVQDRYKQIAITEHALAIEKEKIEDAWKVNVTQLAREAVEQIVGEKTA